MISQNQQLLLVKEYDMRGALLTLLSLILAPPALAVDGVLEINHTCAVQTGCFAGDAAGYPVTIDGTVGRSYRLTTDLIVPDNFDGIVLETLKIAVDLNGFEIVRSGCEFDPTPCTSIGVTGSGITTTDNTYFGQSVTNGAIIGMQNGVMLGNGAEITNLRVRGNSLNGIDANDHARISGIMADSNGVRGVSTGSGAVISGSTVASNGFDGINAGDGSTVSGNTAHDNSSAGIRVADGSTVFGNASYQNASGIVTGDGATIVDNSVSLNGGIGVFAGSIGSTVRSTTANGNTGDGIVVGERSLVSDCTAIDNGGDGIVAGAASSVQRSISRNNAGGTGLALDATATYREVTTGTVTGGIDMGANSCNGTASCP